MYTVTPIAKDAPDNGNARLPYAESPSTIDKCNVYSYADVTNFTNSGFLIVNCDTSKSLYKAYSWHVAGYTV